jgi:hypothetical protein
MDLTPNKKLSDWMMIAVLSIQFGANKPIRPGTIYQARHKPILRLPYLLSKDLVMRTGPTTGDKLS